MKPKNDTELSVVITVMNERENILPLMTAISNSLKGINYEVIFVDDGSTDGTSKRITDHADGHVAMIKLRRNYGQSTAMTAGIDYATGKYIVLLDGDLQNDPADIPGMLRLMKNEDWDVVAGNRKDRKDQFLLKKIPSWIANGLIRTITGVHINDFGCTLKIFKKEVAESLEIYGEMHRFIAVLAKLQGASITQVDVRHHPRIHGRSKYGLNRTFKVMADLMTIVFLRKYIQKPMHLFGTIGFAAAGFGVLINLYLLILKLSGHDIWGKPLLILGLILLLGGIQLITIGILAEISIRNYFEGTKKKTYQVRQVFNGQEKDLGYCEADF